MRNHAEWKTYYNNAVSRRMANILVLNGPNLNLLGHREHEHYGQSTLADIEGSLISLGNELGHQVTCRQSNCEHELINWIHNALPELIDVIIINPAAYTHTSIALRDALLAVHIPFIEVHLSNLDKRESFRQTSYFSDIALGVISGFQTYSYNLALQAADQVCRSTVERNY